MNQEDFRSIGIIVICILVIFGFFSKEKVFSTYKSLANRYSSWKNKKIAQRVKKQINQIREKYKKDDALRYTRFRKELSTYENSSSSCPELYKIFDKEKMEELLNNPEFISFLGKNQDPRFNSQHAFVRYHVEIQSPRRKPYLYRYFYEKNFIQEVEQNLNNFKSLDSYIETSFRKKLQKAKLTKIKYSFVFVAKLDISAKYLKNNKTYSAGFLIGKMYLWDNITQKILCGTPTISTTNTFFLDLYQKNSAFDFVPQDVGLQASQKNSGMSHQLEDNLLEGILLKAYPVFKQAK